MTLLVEFTLPFRDPVLVFSLVLLIILIMPVVFRRLQIPSIIGLILAGVLVGPYGLNLLNRDASIVLLGTVGLLYIMFLAGLELDLNEFKKNQRKSLIFGGLTFSVPFLIGTLVCHYFLQFDWMASVLVASMFSTHTLVAYPIASRLGLTRNEAVIITVGGTIITDTVVLLILAVITGVAGGEAQEGFWLRLLGSLAVFGFILFWGFPRLGRWFFKNVPAESTTQYVFVLAMVFLAASLAELADIEAIIGAFMAGLALNRLIPHSSSLMSRIEFVGNALFIPFFLLSVGMLVDLRVLLAGPTALIVAATLTGIALGGKWLAAWFTQLLYRYSPLERQLIFGLSSAHAAATLAVILVGYNLQLVDENVLNGTIVLILVTCLVSSFVVERSGRRMALVESKKRPELSDRPERILVPIANPNTIEYLMQLAIMIKDPNSPEPIYPLTVVRDAENVDEKLMISHQMLARALQHTVVSNYSIQAVSRIDLNIANGIIRAMRELMITQVLIGWNGKVSTRERIFGSVLDNLLDSTQQMIMVSKVLIPLNTVQRVLVVVPPNANLEKGFDTWVYDVRDLAGQLGATVVFTGEETTLRALQSLLEKRRISLNATYELFNKWNQLPSLLTRISPDELLIVVSARRGMISHDKHLDQVPNVLSKHFEAYSFIIIYPERSTARAPNDFPVPLRQSLPPEGIQSDLPPASPSSPRP